MTTYSLQQEVIELVQHSILFEEQEPRRTLWLEKILPILSLTDLEKVREQFLGVQKAQSDFDQTMLQIAQEKAMTLSQMLIKANKVILSEQEQKIAQVDERELQSVEAEMKNL